MKFLPAGSIMLAPMAGFSDVGFRKLCAEGGADCTVTEMVSAMSLKTKNPAAEKLLLAEDEGSAARAVQIFGTDPRVMAEACENPLLDKFGIIDINMGCPTPKITKTGAGAALLKNPALAAEIVTACVEAAKGRPVTIKMRLGYEKSDGCVEFALKMREAGASAVTVHGRTREQFYTGACDYAAIRRIRDALKIPVIANGDITKANFLRVKELTGCEYFMIGRGALGRPWIFNALRAGAESSPKSGTDIYGFIDKHMHVLEKYFDGRTVVNVMRHHYGWYLKSFKGCRGLRAKLNTLVSLEDVRSELAASLANGAAADGV